MQRFLQRHAESVMGTLSGFDRLRFRGTLRLLAHAGGMMNYLWQRRVLLKDFKEHAQWATEQIRSGAKALSERAGRPLTYLAGSSTSKEDLSRTIAAADRVEQGLICILSCVEPCRSYEIHRNRQEQTLELRNAAMKCLHYYFYFQHPQLGFLHVRLQTWYPFTIHVCLNGREWLARRMDAAGLGYVRRDNCFTELADVRRAQRLFDGQLRTDWPRLLEGLAGQVFPQRATILGDCPVDSYWSVDQSEWATDVLFRSPRELADRYGRWLLHGVTSLGSRDVLRFLGRRTPGQGNLYGALAAEVQTSLRERAEGVRLKHFVNLNSIKMYDKQGSVLRIETTLNSPREMKVYRAKEGDEGGPKTWRYLRKGVADMHRRAEISQAANERYLDSLAAVDDATPLKQLVEPLCRPVAWKGQRVRALNPLAGDDAALLAAVARGEFHVHGFRNGDLQGLLYDAAPRSALVRRRRSAAVTRKLRLLRAHRIIKKIPRTHRYQLTDHGRTLVAAIHAARQANAKQLLTAA
jgi:hypothetical protein